jgi:hypothetical protein
MADIFGRNAQNLRTPLTADQCLINWGGIITNAIQVSISYGQPVNKRRTIGNLDAVIFAGMPSGQINITQLMTTDFSGLFSSPGWQACNPGTLTLTLNGGCAGSTGGGLTLTATGCIVSNFNVQAEAESLTVIDNVVIDFLQLSQSGG